MERDVHHLETWYDATAKRGETRNRLSGNHKADCCVIGGGLAGLTTALELAKLGREVVLLESNLLCGEASGRNGGFVSNGFALGAGDLVARLGEARARALYDLSRRGTTYVRETIRAHDPAIHMGDGMRVAIRYRDNGGLARRGVMLARTFGEDVSVLAAGETRHLLHSECYHDSLHFPHAFHIHPLRYGLLIARLAEASGVRIFERSRALSITDAEGGWCVSSADGTVRARDVVVAISSFDQCLHRGSGTAVLPVFTYVAVTSPLRQKVIATPTAIADTRRAGDYYRLIDEGRLLWGGRITTFKASPEKLVALMHGDMAKTYPSLHDAVIEHAWSGQMAYGIEKMPLIGRDADGIWFATGFGGHGLNTTAMAGLLVAGAIAGQDDSYRQFGQFPPRWAGGAAGRLGVQASYWSMQLRDWFDEKMSR